MMGFLSEQEKTHMQATNKFMYDIGVSRVQTHIQMAKPLHFTAFGTYSNDVISYFPTGNYSRN